MIVRKLMGLYIIKKYNINFIKDEKLQTLQQPFFLLGNHTNFWDPFVMTIGIDKHVNYVANEEYFRLRLTGFMLKIVGAIPKAKFVVDSQSVKGILRLRNEGAIIGVYPEGGRTWPGQTQPIIYSTSKLIKKMGIPVVVTLSKGGSLSFPRWAKKSRVGRIEVEYKVLLDSQQISNMTIDEIHQHLTNALSHDEAIWNRQRQIVFKGKRLAERLEWFIYWCPKCNSFETMVSKNNEYTCTKCGYNVKYNTYGFFESDKNEVLYDNVNVWNDAQFKAMKQKVSQLADKEQILSRNLVRLYKGESRKKRQRYKKLYIKFLGTLSATSKGLTLSDGKNDIVFEAQHINGLVVNHKNTLDFYYHDEKYRLSFINKNICGYIWEDAVKAAKALSSVSITE